MGIVLNRLNIQDIEIKPGSQLSFAAETKVREERERDGEIVEIKHIADRIAELMKAPYNFTAQEARDLIQTERNKVDKRIIDIQGFDIQNLGRTFKGIFKE